MSVLSRWRQRRAIRAGLLKDARADLAARKTKANVARVKLRRGQVDFADRVINRHDAPPVHSPLHKILSSSWGYHPPVHDGVDLICEADAPLLAICDGVITRADDGGWWGKGAQPSGGHPVSDGDGVIVLRCDTDAGPFKKGLNFCYGHAENPTVKVGERVKAGQRIGTAGFANAWHIHFMVNGHGGPRPATGDRDPMPFVNYAVERGA